MIRPGDDRHKDFIATTQRLTTLRERLLADIAAYHTAATDALKSFDEEAQHIQDPAITNNMATLRRKTEEDQLYRERDAGQTITLLDDVLRKGADLQHATNCLMIATSLHTQGEGLDTHIAQARQTPTEYEKTTNTLVARIGTVLAER
jgi:hypothetical protein